MIRAFRPPHASEKCVALGRFFAKNNYGTDFNTIKKYLNTDTLSTWIAVDRLLNEEKVLETFPVYSKKVTTGKKARITFKFRVKDKFAAFLPTVTA